MTNNNNTKKLINRIPISIIIAIVFVAGFVLGNQYTVIMAAQTGPSLPADVEDDFAAFYQTYNLIDSEFIDAPETDVLVGGAIKGMVEALDDRFSYYLTPEEYAFESEDYNGEIQGIGVVITTDEESQNVVIVNVLSDTPAERAGLMEGDVFMVVNGEDVTGLSTVELGTRVRGPEGTTVDITVQRGSEMLDFTIERARIPIPNVEHKLLDGDIGYIYMEQFTRMSRPQVDAALDDLKQNDLKGLIFDLRGNPGGLLSSATEIASLFLKDDIILIEDFGDGQKTVFRVQDDIVLQVDGDNENVYSRDAAYGDLNIPIVVLLNRSSASASEVVAGAWQDNDAVTIIGETSFGKGTVQIQSALVNGGAARLTVARWLTPKGHWIDKNGITPDIEITIPEGITFDAENDPFMKAAIDYINSQNGESSE